MNTLYDTPRTCYDVKMINTFNTSNEYNINCPKCDDCHKLTNCQLLKKMQPVLTNYQNKNRSSTGVGGSSVNIVTYDHLNTLNTSNCSSCRR